MHHQMSPEDQQFLLSFERFEVAPDDFGHRAHVRLAYGYLCAAGTAAASAKMKQALLAFLDHLGVGETKFHETITRAWIDAVAHFMAITGPCQSFQDFIKRNPVLCDSKIMLSHYSATTLFSDAARQQYLEPDLQPIPKH